MRWFSRWYGAGPLHLLTMIGCAALAGYAAVRFPPQNAVVIALWFAGAVIGHDLVLLPLYSLADRSATAVLRHRRGSLPAVPWVNYLRVPVALSGLLLLIWFPLIFRLSHRYTPATTLSDAHYLMHWLAVTAALFLASALLFALRLRPRRRIRADYLRQQFAPPGHDGDGYPEPDPYPGDGHGWPGEPGGDEFYQAAGHDPFFQAGYERGGYPEPDEFEGGYRRPAAPGQDGPWPADPYRESAADPSREAADGPYLEPGGPRAQPPREPDWPRTIHPDWPPPAGQDRAPAVEDPGWTAADGTRFPYPPDLGWPRPGPSGPARRRPRY